MNTYRKFRWPVALAIVLIVGLVVSFVRIPISFTEAEAQAMLDNQLAKFNKQHENKHVIESAVISFGEGEMTLRAAGRGTINAQSVSAAIHSTGIPKFVRPGVYFVGSQFEVSSLLINGLEPTPALQQLLQKQAEKLKERRDQALDRGNAGGLIRKFATVASEFATDAVIDSSSESLQQLVATYEHDIRALMEGVVLTYTQHAPLYVLGKNTNERLAAAVLTDISVHEGKITAMLSGARLMWTVLTFMLLLLVAGAWAYAIWRDRMPA